MTLTFLNETLQRFILACDAAGIKPADVRLGDFTQDTRERLKREADEMIRAFINRPTTLD